ncbi:MAG: hypothetical protein ACYTHN_15305 [Planctomycetota bacterium]
MIRGGPEAFGFHTLVLKSSRMRALLSSRRLNATKMRFPMVNAFWRKATQTSSLYLLGDVTKRITSATAAKRSAHA